MPQFTHPRMPIRHSTPMPPITSPRSGAGRCYCQSLVVLHGFAHAAEGRAVENQLIRRGAQWVMLAGLHPQQHIRNPIQVTWRKNWKRIPVVVFVSPAPLVHIPKQTVQDLIGENQRLRLRGPDRRRLQGGADCSNALLRPLFPGLRRCRRSLPGTLATVLRRHGLETALAANLPTHASSLPEQLCYIHGQLPCHANGPFALSALRRLGRVTTPCPIVAGVTALMRRRSHRRLPVDLPSRFRRWREGKVRPIQGNAPHAPAGKPEAFFTALMERLRRSLTRHSVTAVANNPGMPRVRFLRHGGIYHSDGAFRAIRAGAGLPPPVGRHRGPAKERDGRSAPCPSSAMSSDRLFLDRVGRHQSPSPLHRHAQISTRFPRAYLKPELSTLLGIGTFYFALTRTRRLASPRPAIVLRYPKHENGNETTSRAVTQCGHAVR